MTKIATNSLLREYVISEQHIILEALSDDMVQRYNAIIDKVDGFKNALDADGLVKISEILGNHINLVKEEMVALSDAGSEKGLGALVNWVKTKFKTKSKLENLEVFADNLDSALRRAYKYVSAAMTRDTAAQDVTFSDYEIQPKQKAQLQKLLQNVFTDFKSDAKNNAVALGNELYENLSLSKLKSLITQLDAISELIKSEYKEILSVNKKIEPKVQQPVTSATPEGEKAPEAPAPAATPKGETPKRVPDDKPSIIKVLNTVKKMSDNDVTIALNQIKNHLQNKL